MSTKVTRICVSIPTDMLKTIDGERGDVPRSRYVLRMMEGFYNNSGDGKGKKP